MMLPTRGRASLKAKGHETNNMVIIQKHSFAVEVPVGKGKVSKFGAHYSKVVLGVVFYYKGVCLCVVGCAYY